MAQNDANTYKTLAKNTGLFAISSFASKVLVFFLTPLYTYVLSTEEYGVADLINTTIHFIYPVLTLAIADATLRYALEKNVSHSAVLNNSMLVTLLSTVVLMLFYPVMSALSSEMKEYWLVFVVNFTLFNIQECFANFLKGIGKTKLFALQGVFHTVTLITCNILLLLVFRQKLNGYLLSIIIGHLVPILVMFFAGKLYRYWTGFKIDKPLMTQMLKYSIPMIPTLLAWAINTSIDKYMIIGFLGIGESGIYSVAHKIPSILTTVLAIFIQAWQLSAISNHGAAEESKYYTNVYKGLNCISVLVCMTIIGGAKLISGILFSNEFYAAWQCVPMLIISALFSSHAGFLAAAFRAAKKTGGLLISVTMGSIVNVALNLFLINWFGIVGAAIGTATGFFVLWLVRIVKIQAIVRVEINVMKTLAEYALMILSAVLITFEMPYAYHIFVMAFAVIIALNFNQMKSVFTLVWNTVQKKVVKH